MRHKVLLIDNYDSFTYNLVQALSVLEADVHVHRNDQVDVDACRSIEPTHLVVSPGPGRPEKAGVSVAAIEHFVDKIPVLGVCLGHQALATVFGGKVVQAQRLMHGKKSRVYHDSKAIYQGIPNPFEAGRYHSLAVQDESLPQELAVCSYTSDGEIMGLRHRTLPVEGVQFHPESILTPEGNSLLENFLEVKRPVGFES